jgi:uncharacterized protein involved in exopolysaccharide biosynthesis
MNDTRDAPHVDDDVTLLDFALVVAGHLRTIIFLPLGAGLMALAVTFAIAPTFTATTKLLPPQQQQSLASALATQLSSLANPAVAAVGIKNPADTYVAMLKSRTVADALIERFDLRELYKVQYNEEARKELEYRTSISAGRDGLITVSVDDHEPKRAAELANAYVEALLDLTQTLAVTEAGHRRIFFERQVKQSRDDLTRAELALRGAGIDAATLNTVPGSALEFVASLKAKVTAQEIKLAAMRGFMTESNPEFKQAQNELAALRKQLTKTEQDDGGKLGTRGADYIGRLRDFKYHESLFEVMAKQYELARLDEAREGAVIQVMDPAIPPNLKSKPRRTLIAVVTTLVASILILMWLFVRQGVRSAALLPGNADKLTQLRGLVGLRRR